MGTPLSAPITGALPNGDEFVICDRSTCAFHAGLVGETDEGLTVPGCGKPEITWDGDEGECKDFSDSSDLRPGDLEMARENVALLGAIGPWSYRVRGTEVVKETFLEASGKAEGIDPRFREAVEQLARNEIAPGPILSDLEEARFGRDRSADIETIVEASKDAQPGDAIVFDEMTGSARAMDQDLALAGGARPHEGLVGFKEGPPLPREHPRLMGRIQGEEWVVSPLDPKKALEWIMNIVEPTSYSFAEMLNQPALMKGTIEKSLIGRDIGIGVITEADANLETGICDVTIELHSGEPQEVFHVSFRTPEKRPGLHGLMGGEKGSDGVIVEVETPEQFLEKIGIDLAASPDTELVEVDGIVVEKDSMPGEFKESVPVGDAQSMITDAVCRDVCDVVDELYWGEALEDASCSDCAMRPKGHPTSWIGAFPPGESLPKCHGKDQWLGVNKACRYFANRDEEAAEVDVEDEIDDTRPIDECMTCGGHMEKRDGFYQCEDCHIEEEDHSYEEPPEEDDWDSWPEVENMLDDPDL